MSPLSGFQNITPNLIKLCWHVLLVELILHNEACLPENGQKLLVSSSPAEVFVTINRQRVGYVLLDEDAPRPPVSLLG